MDLAGNLTPAVYIFALLEVSGLIGGIYVLSYLVKPRSKGILFYASLLAVGLNLGFYAKVALIPSVRDWVAASYFSQPLPPGIPKFTTGTSLHIALPRHDGNLCIEALGQGSFNSRFCWISFARQIKGGPMSGSLDFIVTGTGPYQRWAWTQDTEICAARNPAHPDLPCVAPVDVAQPDADLRLDVTPDQTGWMLSEPVAIFRLKDTRTGALVDEFHHALGQWRYRPFSATLYTRRTDGPIRQIVMSK